MPRNTRSRIRRHQRHAAGALGGISTNTTIKSDEKSRTVVGERDGRGKENNCNKGSSTKNTEQWRTDGEASGDDDVDVRMVDEFFIEEDDSVVGDMERHACSRVANTVNLKKRRGPLAAIAAKLLNHKTTTQDSPTPSFRSNTSPAAIIMLSREFSSRALSIGATSKRTPYASSTSSSIAGERFQTFQSWFVPRMKSKEWRRANTKFTRGKSDSLGRLPTDSIITVFSYHHGGGATRRKSADAAGGSGNPVVGAIILSLRDEQEQQWSTRSRIRYDRICRAFLEIDDRTGNVVKQWTNFAATSANDFVIYRHMIEKLRTSHDQTVVFRDQTTLHEANEAGKLNFRYTYALCLLDKEQPRHQQQQRQQSS